MQISILAVALSTQIAGAIVTHTEESPSYIEACRIANVEGKALLVILEKPEFPADTSLMPFNNVSSRFQICRIDATTGYGSRIAKSFGANEFPFAVVANQAGDIVYRGLATVKSPPQRVTETLADRYEEPVAVAARPGIRSQEACCRDGLCCRGAGGCPGDRFAVQTKPRCIPDNDVLPLLHQDET